ncbi:hypothetical protein [Alicyclobacillus herbarius]|uniref:hypothetical protein n=1 Tax=Alicyclobacillus herbarius TaxID=122960 RepID=UPI0003F65ED4|nr:hypothetical protein [Alicyclobacillus herbarius]
MHNWEKGAQDVRITGEGTLGQGTYRDVRVLGSGVVQGDCRCRGFKVHGETEVFGRLDAAALRVYGTLSARRDIEVKELHVFGTLTADGAVRGGEARVFGTLDVHGPAAVDTMNIFGMLTVDGDCQAEWFRCRGGVQIEGLLNAGHIRFDLGGQGMPCSVREIGAEHVEVRRRRDVLAALQRMFGNRGSGHLTATVIEGDVVRLEDTEADVVRGNRIELGPGCRVRRVEYRSGYQQADDAQVEEVVQV